MPQSQQNKFLDLLRPVMKNLEKFTLSLTRNREDAKELAAEVIATAYRSFGSLRDEKAFPSFLFTIASRKYGKVIAAKKELALEPEHVSGLYSDTLSPEQAADIQILYEAMDLLPVETKEALILFEINGFSQKEIAVIQNCSLSAVKMRLTRGREKLRELLGIPNEKKTDIKVRQ